MIVTRRRFFGFISAPAIVSAASLMPIKTWNEFIIEPVVITELSPRMQAINNILARTFTGTVPKLNSLEAANIWVMNNLVNQKHETEVDNWFLMSKEEQIAKIETCGFGFSNITKKPFLS